VVGSRGHKLHNGRIGTSPSNPVSVTTVFTDGACQGNPGPGGWGWVVPDGPWASGAQEVTTNQRMELTAALEAVRALGGPLQVFSDSTYVVHCFRDRWWAGWLQRGWRTSSKKQVVNRDLWEPLIDLYRQAPDDISFVWVKGHSGNRWNDVADHLAVEAARAQTGAGGEDLNGIDLGRFGLSSGAGTGSAGDSAGSGSLSLPGLEPPEEELKLF